MPDHAFYINAAFGVTAVVYGGAFLLWRLELRRLQQRLARESDAHAQE